jgi:hypothetical protein
MEMPNDVAELSILGWILKARILTEKGDPLDFHDRLFLLDILTDWSKDIVIKKCSQVGGSVIFNLKALFALRAFGWNIIYTMPTDSDVEEFVKTKTNGIIRQNPQAFVGASQDSIYLKQIGDRNLFFKGTVSKTAAISTSADLNIHDEASRSDQSTIETYKSRLKASQFRGRWLFSNPTSEKDAIDEAWKKSDQKEWEITCTKCSLPQPLKWPESIDLARKCFQCQGCKKELSRDERRLGKWVAQRPGAAISGYHISHLMAPWISAAEIIADSEGDQEYFYNFILGEPYNPGDLRVSASTILDNWTPQDLTKGHDWYLGVDVGNIKHYVLGTELGVTQVGRFTKWSELDDLMKLHKPTLVIDAMPDNTMSKYYVENYRAALMSFFQENKNNPKTIVWWGENDKQGVVYSNRNRILDQLIDHILNAKMLFGISTDAELKRYLKQWETLRRIKVTDTKGIESYEWTSTTGEDHYVFATLYFYLATLSAGNGVVFPERGRSKKQFIDNNNVVGTLEELSEIIAQANE